MFRQLKIVRNTWKKDSSRNDISVLLIIHITLHLIIWQTYCRIGGVWYVNGFTAILTPYDWRTPSLHSTSKAMRESASSSFDELPLVASNVASLH